MRHHATAKALLLALLAGQAAAQGVLPGEEYTFLVASPLSAPNPVTGADGRVHLAYEILVTNPSHIYIGLDKLEAVDSAGAALATLEGDGLAAMTVASGLVDGSIAPGGLAVVLLDVAFDPEAALPDYLSARITSTRRTLQSDGSLAPLPATAAVPATMTFTAATTPVGSAPARTIAPPLRGPGWVAVNGCCDAPVSHRTGYQVIDSAIEFPERFAIDWVQLGPDGGLFTGDGSKLEDYAFYGAPVYAVADAVVASVYDGLDPQVPLGRDPNLKPIDITGNSIILDLGDGTWALYAHLLKDSLTVKPGDKVTAGQEIARLGNTGNSDGPHLHFQLMDSPSALKSNGLPYVLETFTSRGVLAGGADAAFEAAASGKPAAIDASGAGTRAGALPLNDEVVDFD